MTQPGRILFRHAEKILAEYETVMEEISRTTGRLSGEIRIGTASLLGKYLMPKLIGHFKREYPDVEILMLVGNSGKLIEELKQHALDLVIVSEPVSAQRFIVRPFLDDELVVIVNPDHAWAKRRALDVQELLEQSIIDREEGSGTREVFHTFLSAHYISFKDLRVVMTMGSSEAVKSGVESGVAYGVVSKMAVRREIESGLLHQIKIRDASLKRRFLVVYPPELYNKYLVSNFLDFIAAQTNPQP